MRNEGRHGVAVREKPQDGVKSTPKRGTSSVRGTRIWARKSVRDMCYARDMSQGTRYICLWQTRYALRARGRRAEGSYDNDVNVE